MRRSSIISRGQPTKGGPTAWGLGKVVTTPYRKTLRYKTLHNASDFDWIGTGGGQL